MLIPKKTAPSISLYLTAEERELLVEWGNELRPVEYSHQEITTPSLNSMRPITRLLNTEDAKFMKRSGASSQDIQDMLTARAVIFRGYARNLWQHVCDRHSIAATAGDAPALDIYRDKCRTAWFMGKMIFGYSIRRISPRKAHQIVKDAFAALELELRSPVIPISARN